MDILFINIIYTLLLITIIISKFNYNNNKLDSASPDIDVIHNSIHNIYLLYISNKHYDADIGLKKILYYISYLTERNYLNFNESKEIEQKILEIRKIILTLGHLSEKREILINKHLLLWKQHFQKK